MIEMTNAVVYPWTMMIHLHYTSNTYTYKRLYKLTYRLLLTT